MTNFSSPRGTHDVLPPRSELAENIVRTAEDMFARYGYHRIDTPVFEDTELFSRALEEGSDIVVKKEMYTFQDRGGRSLTLRPEGTAPVVRAVLEHNLHKGGIPVKLYYVAPMFRYERPQAGRHRQHTQVGVEAVGAEGPNIDAEVLELADAFYKSLEITDYTLYINSVGHPECRAAYLPKLVEFLRLHESELDADCRRRIETNPLRTFDCKVERDREILGEAPFITDHLCADCRTHFERVQELLHEVGVVFKVEPRLVRGLDYYTRTTFEFEAAGLGAHNVIGAGGRYDGLAELLGGDRLPGVGFGLGVDRIADAVLRQKGFDPQSVDVFIVSVGEAGQRAAWILATELRHQGFSVDLDSTGRGVKAQFKEADRKGAGRVLVIGDRELQEGRLTLRDMVTGEESSLPKGEVAQALRETE